MAQTPNTKAKVRSPSKKSPKNTVSAFIAKTYEILEDHKFPEIIDWDFEGTSIVIKKPLEFAQQVLPIYFKHQNLTSFVRQLNMYSFRKQRTAKVEHIYCHELFQRDKKYLIEEIRRKNQGPVRLTSKERAEVPEATELNQDVTTLVQEKQVLRRSNNQAINKISCLEGKIKELSLENDALQNQLNQQGERDKILISLMGNILKKYGIPPTGLSSMMLQEAKGQVLMELGKDDKATINIIRPKLPRSASIEEQDVNAFLNFEGANAEDVRTDSTVLNSKGTVEEKGSINEISPFSLFSNEPAEAHYDSHVPNKCACFCNNNGEQGTCYVSKIAYCESQMPNQQYVPQQYAPQQYGYYSQPNIYYQGQVESNLGKRVFDEEKQTPFINEEAFGVVYKRRETTPSVQSLNQNNWNNDILLNTVFIKNLEFGDDYNNDPQNYKLAW